jgi:hypothetical protein
MLNLTERTGTERLDPLTNPSYLKVVSQVQIRWTPAVPMHRLREAGGNQSAV